MKDPSLNPLRCFVDPISASILALGTAAGGAAGGILPSILGKAPPQPAAAPPPAPPIQGPQGTPGGNAAAAQAPGGAGTSSPSFVGSSSLPQQSGYGAKTLLGQ